MGFFDWLSRLFRPDSDAPPTPRPPALPRQQRRNKTAPHQTRQPRGARAASRGSALSPEPSGPVAQAQLALTRALSEPARAEGFAQLRAANGPGSPAEQLGSSFVLQLLPTVEGLQGPAVVIGYVDPADCPSAVPEILKARHLSIHLEHEGKQRRLIVMNKKLGRKPLSRARRPGRWRPAQVRRMPARRWRAPHRRARPGQRAGRRTRCMGALRLHRTHRGRSPRRRRASPGPHRGRADPAPPSSIRRRHARRSKPADVPDPS